MKRGWLATIVAATLVVAIPATSVTVRAQPAAPADKKKQAGTYVNAGLAAQDGGDYDTALTFYAKAYELVPHPLIIFNMAQANRLAGRDQKAIDLYKQYLDQDPKGPKAKDAKEFVLALQTKLDAAAAKKIDDAKKAEEAKQAAKQAAEDARKAEAARKAEEERKAAEARGVEQAKKDQEARQAAEARKEEEARKQAERDRPKPGRTMRLAGIGAGAAGVLGVGVGIYFGLQAKSLSDELSVHNAPYDPDKEARGKADDRNLVIGTVVGGVLILGGGALYFLGHKKGESAHGGGVAVAPSWQRGPGLVVAAEF